MQQKIDAEHFHNRHLVHGFLIFPKSVSLMNGLSTLGNELKNVIVSAFKAQKYTQNVLI